MVVLTAFRSSQRHQGCLGAGRNLFIGQLLTSRVSQKYASVLEETGNDDNDEDGDDTPNLKTNRKPVGL